MATHSSTLAWKIPWREEPGRLQSMRSQRVRHDWATSMSMSMSKGRGKTSGASVVSIWPVPYTCALYSEVPQIIFNTSCFHLKSLNDFWMKVLAFSLCTGSWKLCHQLETSIILQVLSFQTLYPEHCLLHCHNTANKGGHFALWPLCFGDGLLV